MPINIHLYLDTRKSANKETAPVKMSFSRGGKNTLLPLGVSVPISQWNKSGQCLSGKDMHTKTINSFLLERRHTIERILFELVSSGKSSTMSIIEVKNYVAKKLSPNEESFVGVTEWFKQYIENASSESTKEIYRATLNKILLYDKNADKLKFEDINIMWLTKFEKWLPSTGCVKKNSSSMHLRNIRSVFNSAINNDITAHYPFRHFSIKFEETDKRCMSVDDLRELLTCKASERQQKYVDAFRLTFLLIGINMKDLLSALPAENGRVVYKRAKTRKMYSIKIEPEAQELLDKYKGSEHLVCWGEGNMHYRTFNRQTNLYLKKVKGGAFPYVSTYTARHSWATIAAELEIPIETIAAALGHSYGNRTTAIYIKFNQSKVDEANRKVIDWVLYGKR